MEVDAGKQGGNLTKLEISLAIIGENHGKLKYHRGRIGIQYKEPRKNEGLTTNHG